MFVDIARDRQMIDQYEEWSRLVPGEIQTRLMTWVKSNGSWKRVYPKYGAPYGIPSVEAMKMFTFWLLERVAEQDRSLLGELDVDETDDVEFEHTHAYYYDSTRDVYIVHLPSKKRPFLLQGDFWRSIREGYSNWDGSPESVNEICRNYHLSRTTVVELLRAMGVTHSSSPWTDEVLSTSSEEDLVEDLLRRKEEQVYVRAQQREYRNLKRDAERYRKLHLYARTIREYFKEISVGAQDVVVSGFSPKIFSASRNQYSLVLSPTDFHWGKYGARYGGDEYNRDIARERLFACTKDVLDRCAERGAPDVVYLAIGGDGLHIDNQQKGTTRGTPQDCDGTATEIAHTYIKMLVEYIHFVKQYAPVHVFCIAGNHDFYTTALIRSALLGWFNSDTAVSIEDDLSPRQSVLYGNSLVTFVHGDDKPLSKFSSIIASENAELWGKSKFRFVFTGHLHTERELPTFGDITVYRMPSLAGTDEYHFRKGYKSRKALIGYVVSFDRGVIATEISPVT